MLAKVAVLNNANRINAGVSVRKSLVEIGEGLNRLRIDSVEVRA
jgi:hypothetical protein